ncbi:MAG: ImmA/IrrE family metallo-endopeptidase [Clostridia bacterium]|nr:ImmA/IrrE family metallo-endopeptidase [Clostridia bacterium]
MIDRYKQTVIDLCKQYKTTDPFDLADKLGIFLLREDLGKEIDGFYVKSRGRSFICVNSSLPDHLMRLTLAHELGHAVLHPDLNSVWLKQHTLYAGSKYEKEADLFAIHLLMQDMDELPDSIGSLARKVGMDVRKLAKILE